MTSPIGNRVNGVLEKEGLDKFPTMLKINIFERMFHHNFIIQYHSELRKIMAKLSFGVYLEYFLKEKLCHGLFVQFDLAHL